MIPEQQKSIITDHCGIRPTHYSDEAWETGSSLDFKKEWWVLMMRQQQKNIIVIMTIVEPTPHSDGASNKRKLGLKSDKAW